MALLSTNDFNRRGHQVDLDVANLDGAIRALAAKNLVPAGERQTWEAQKAEWQAFFNEHVRTVSILPWRSSDDLDRWTDRVTGWRAKLNTWAKTPEAARTVAAIPTSAATVVRAEERIAEAKKAAQGTPPWVIAVLGSALLLSFGYALSSAARIGGR